MTYKTCLDMSPTRTKHGDMSRHVLYVMFTQDLDSKEFSSALGDMPPIYLYIVGGVVGWQDLDVWDWFIHSCR